jgi:hypothetical protein
MHSLAFANSKYKPRLEYTCTLPITGTEVTRPLEVPTDSNAEVQSEVDTTPATKEMQQGLLPLYQNVQLSMYMVSHWS